ncbi:MAG TPA: SDR family NAD(P)-dependent oxidoreductase, partial [Gemmatimonadales bacterium]
MKIDLSGQVAFVTGSTRGIGLAIAERLHAAGARVAIVGRQADQAAQVAARIGAGAAGFGCDVASAA